MGGNFFLQELTPIEKKDKTENENCLPWSLPSYFKFQDITVIMMCQHSIKQSLFFFYFSGLGGSFIFKEICINYLNYHEKFQILYNWYCGSQKNKIKVANEHFVMIGSIWTYFKHFVMIGSIWTHFICVLSSIWTHFSCVTSSIWTFYEWNKRNSCYYESICSMNEHNMNSF